MGNLVLNGATSGGITISPPAVAGTNTLTLPAATGTFALTASPTFTGVTSLGIGSGVYANNADMRLETSTGYGWRMGTTSSSSTLGYFYIQGSTDNFVSSFINSMYIDTSGNLLVGTTNTDPINNKNNAVTMSSGILRAYLSSGNPANFGTGTIGNVVDIWYNGANLVGTIATNGSNCTFNSVSDYRLKTNIQPLKNALSTISALNPSTYDWISGNTPDEGFIAHELQALIPHAVIGEKDAVNEDGSIKPQGVDYSKIVVHLVAAIQELSAKNDALEARLAALEAK